MSNKNLKLTNTKTGSIVELTQDEFFNSRNNAWFPQIQYVAHNLSLDGVKMSVETEDGNFEDVDNYEDLIIENWNTHSADWPSPQGIRPVWELEITN